MIINARYMFASVAVVGQVVALRMEAVLVSGPDDSVGFALPLVRVLAAPHVVARFRSVAGIGDARLVRGNAVSGLIPVMRKTLSISNSG